MRYSLIASALLGALALPQVASADEPAKEEPSYTLTGNVSIVSEYIYRGIGQSNRKPAIQGGFDFAHNSGFYLGTWGSSISWLNDADVGEGSSMEWDFYGGYKGTVGDFGYDVGLLQYYYPGNFDGFTSPNTTEGYVGASWKFLSAKASYAFTNLFGAQTPEGKDTDGSYYLELNGTYEVGAGFSAVGHVGYQSVKDFDDASYTDWKLGVTKDFLGLSWGLYYVGTNAKGKEGEFYHNAFGKDLGDSRALLTVSKTL